MSHRDLLLLGDILTCPTPKYTRVQIAHGVTYSGPGPWIAVTITPGAATTTGNCLFVWTRSWWGQCASVTDGTNSFTLVATVVDGIGEHELQLWYCPNITGTAANITCSWGFTSGGEHVVCMAEYSGLLAAPLDALSVGTKVVDSGPYETHPFSDHFNTAEADELILVGASGFPGYESMEADTRCWVTVDSSVDSIGVLGYQEGGKRPLLQSAHASFFSTLGGFGGATPTYYVMIWAAFKTTP
ncbi:MAG TPA: hypothetical protein VM487_12070 [Phycisphaerae bacterium]|nr:hypothetical protein [Phycisphaerae bacterium]